MGCDIHICIEYKTRTGWVNCNHYEKDRYEEGFRLVSFYRQRNYNLFSVLCGVRNSYDIEPISPPKGLPENIHKDSKSYIVDDWGDDGHSHSWNTLRELIEYKIQPIKYKGMITKMQKEELEKGIKPTSWCEWTSNPDAVYAEWIDENPGNPLEYLIKKIKNHARDNYLVFSEEDMLDNIRIIYCFDN